MKPERLTARNLPGVPFTVSASVVLRLSVALPLGLFLGADAASNSLIASGVTSAACSRVRRDIVKLRCIGQCQGSVCRRSKTQRLMTAKHAQHAAGLLAATAPAARGSDAACGHSGGLQALSRASRVRCFAGTVKAVPRAVFFRGRPWRAAGLPGCPAHSSPGTAATLPVTALRTAKLCAIPCATCRRKTGSPPSESCIRGWRLIRACQ